ncbi:unnamed protein product, partial [Amaranthus hypochondriacus]
MRRSTQWLPLHILKEALKKPLLLGRLRSNLYYVEDKLVPIAHEDLLQLCRPPITENRSKTTLNTTVCVQEEDSQSLEKIKLWHLRLGHMPFNRLQIVFPDLHCKNFNKHFLCTVCPLGKQTRKPFHNSSIKTIDTFQLV